MHGEVTGDPAGIVVCACPQTADVGGVLLLDPSGGPHWRLVSSRCDLVYAIPPFVHRLSLGAPCGCATARHGIGGATRPVSDPVSGHACRNLIVEFRRELTPLPEGQTAHVACFLSDELLQALCEPQGGAKGGAAKGKGGKGKGKGGRDARGKGGRGRGKGN